MGESCWEVVNCEHGPESEEPCVVVNYDFSDGFLGGKNGSRACFYIGGTPCTGKYISIPEKMKKYCLDCAFYQKIQLEEGVNSNIYYYLKHVEDRLDEFGTLEQLPLI